MRRNAEAPSAANSAKRDPLISAKAAEVRDRPTDRAGLDPVLIDKCVAYRCRAKLREALHYSSGATERPVIDILIVEISSGAHSGFGEMYPTSLNYPRGIPGTSALEEWNEILASCSELLGKDALDLRGLIPRRYIGVDDASGIVDCLDFALHDLVGKAKNIPAWALLGGKRRSKVPAMPVIHTDEDNRMVRKANDWQQKWGIRMFKLKPHAGFDEDARLMREFAHGLAPGTRFLLDANYAYKSVEEAARTLAEVARYGVFLAEDPVKSDYDTLREDLRPALNRAGVMLMLDQQARSMSSVFEIVRSRCADAINFHANWHSGFGGALERAFVVRAGGMKNFLGSSIYTGIADAANILLASTFPDLLACEQVRGADFYLDSEASVVDEFYPLRDGYYHIPDRPGLGIEVSRSKLERLTEEKVTAVA